MPIPKQPLQSANRQPQGVPVGGQFAATAHSEPDVTISSSEPFAFTEADDEKDPFANSPADGSTGDDPSHEYLAGDSGNGGLPPGSGGSGGSGGGEEREASRNIVFAAAANHKQLKLAKTISLSADHRGNLRVDDVADLDGKSIQLDYRDAPLAESLQLEINGNVPGGHGLPARHIIDHHKSVSIDAAALLNGDIKVTGPGKLHP